MKTKKRLIILVLFLFTIVVSTGVLFIIDRKISNKNYQTDEQSETTSTTETANEIDSSVASFTKVDFQSTIDNWADPIVGNKSVIIYDLDRNEIVASYNPNENYNTASLYKLFVVYEGYRRIESGIWDANTLVGYTNKTILECLDLAIRESNSPCAESLWVNIGHSELDNIIEGDFGISNTNISNLLSNAPDILKIMQLFYAHPDIKNSDLLVRMKDSFLNQPITTYNWRQGLPSGFKKAQVYNKVGWDYNTVGGYWNIYHDAAIVEFPDENRHFIIIVMTNRVPYQKIAELGTLIEDSFYTQSQ